MSQSRSFSVVDTAAGVVDGSDTPSAIDAPMTLSQAFTLRNDLAVIYQKQEPYDVFYYGLKHIDELFFYINCDLDNHRKYPEGCSKRISERDQRISSTLWLCEQMLEDLVQVYDQWEKVRDASRSSYSGVYCGITDALSLIFVLQSDLEHRSVTEGYSFSHMILISVIGQIQKSVNAAQADIENNNKRRMIVSATMEKCGKVTPIKRVKPAKIHQKSKPVSSVVTEKSIYDLTHERFTEYVAVRVKELSGHQKQMEIARLWVKYLNGKYLQGDSSQQYRRGNEQRGLVAWMWSGGRCHE